MKRVALTGGIASGKSTVAGLLAEQGVEVVDTDRIAHQLATPGSKLVQELAGALGPWVVGADGALDRQAVRDRVFADEQLRKRLERVAHPAIRAEMDRRVQRAPSGAPYVLLVIPLLVEAAWHDAADAVVVVDCPAEVQLARLREREGMDAGTAERIIDSQASREQRLAVADHVIVNDGSIDSLRRRTLAVHEELASTG